MNVRKSAFHEDVIQLSLLDILRLVFRGQIKANGVILKIKLV